jgi:hypothetical protein
MLFMSFGRLITSQPTPYADLNVVLCDLVTRVRNVVGDNFIDAYPRKRSGTSKTEDSTPRRLRSKKITRACTNRGVEFVEDRTMQGVVIISKARQKSFTGQK